MSKRELIDEQRKQRLVGRFGFDQPVGGVVQDGFENGEVLGLIVHDQNVDRAVARRSGRADMLRLDVACLRLSAVRCREVDNGLVCRSRSSHRFAFCATGGFQRNSHTRIRDRSWSVLTGLAM